VPRTNISQSGPRGLREETASVSAMTALTSIRPTFPTCGRRALARRITAAINRAGGTNTNNRHGGGDDRLAMWLAAG